MARAVNAPGPLVNVLFMHHIGNIHFAQHTLIYIILTSHVVFYVHIYDIPYINTTPCLVNCKSGHIGLDDSG